MKGWLRVRGRDALRQRVIWSPRKGGGGSKTLGVERPPSYSLQILFSIAKLKRRKWDTGFVDALRECRVRRPKRIAGTLRSLESMGRKARQSCRQVCAALHAAAIVNLSLMRWFERKIRRYEHRRWTTDDNRRVQPFEWGLEHIDGSLSESNPGEYVRQYAEHAIGD